MKAQTETPWLDQNGKLHSDEEIRSVSKNWTPEIWEGFLAATEIIFACATADGLSQNLNSASLGIESQSPEVSGAKDSK